MMFKNKQNTSQLLMVRPANFGFNEETAENNSFQRKSSQSADEIQKTALKEFDDFVGALRNVGIQVTVIQDSEDPPKPDAIFPNNWVSFHEDNSVITYPMFSPKRRLERKESIIDEVETHFKIDNRYSLEQYEDKNQFLEGTGSMVLDRANRIVYACLSPRTDIKLIDKFCVLKGYQPIHFKAQSEGVDIYHTNVLMAMGEDCVVICLDAIPNIDERKIVENKFEQTGKEIIEITQAQMNSFAGNMLEVENADGKKYMIMSQQALNSLKVAQITAIEKYAKILSSPIPTIEKLGGGSARCMMAEIFLAKKA